MKIICVIPARFASQRLPGKPMKMIGNAPMIEWVYKRACQVKRFNDVIVATDNQQIFNYISSIGGKVIMTPEDLASGTDRVAFVAKDMGADIFLNLQGDEPLILPEVLDKVCSAFSDPAVQIATPVTKIKTVGDLTDPNLVRVTLDQQLNALYFTRAIIPHYRDLENHEDWLSKFNYYKHIGIYAYRKDFLLHLTQLNPGELEKVEKLEQLRVLENGYKIRVVITKYESRSVDTQEDLIEINKFVKNHQITME
jgi:3-deoxy-manno-octulosonate cytidylyltransferase (CMP-KDO synthetase)